VLAEHALRPAARGASPARGERLVIVVRARKGQAWPPLLAALREANRNLAEHKRVSEYVVLEREFPRTASLKIKRDQLAALAREHGAERKSLAAEPTGARA
jgi:acyl-coenzyme A synthetase/AMP-(fatty) acid ligase